MCLTNNQTVSGGEKIQKTSSISEEYEAFLRRVISVLGQDTVQAMNSQQATVLQETLAELWEGTQNYEGITNEMIKGAWDVTIHIHPVDGSFRYWVGSREIRLKRELSASGIKKHFTPPGVAEEVVVDVGEHTPTKFFF